jgi:hypothetical protein
MLHLGDAARGRGADQRSAEVRGDNAAPRAIGALLAANALAGRGAYDSALATTDSLTGIPARRTDDPFFRAILHLLRADWYARSGPPLRARGDLLWHENSDVYGYPTGDPQPAEVDWAFAPLAQWRLARLLERAGTRTDEACRAYTDVARLWADGEPPYRARADSAGRRLVALGCRGAA